MRRLTEPTLGEAEYRTLRDLVAARCGILFGEGARLSLERRLRERLTARGLQTFAEYSHYLRFHPAAEEEWEEALELVATHETYFHREDYQLRAFRDEVLPGLAAVAKARGRLSLWSAGCSTGEEVYTLAILVHESGLFRDCQVRVYGSDLSRRCVATARRGVYGASSFRVAPPEWKKTYFAERPDGFHLSPRIKALCHFGHLNLLHGDQARLLGRQDAVFCRNVLIYLDGPARRRVIDTLHGRLHPGGYLFLGHSESLLNVSTAFELVHLREDLVYRRPPATVAPP